MYAWKITLRSLLRFGRDLLPGNARHPRRGLLVKQAEGTGIPSHIIHSNLDGVGSLPLAALDALLAREGHRFPL
jgi:hypothetical protein